MQSPSVDRSCSSVGASGEHLGKPTVMNAAPPTVFCVTTAKTLKEIGPLVQSLARVRWVPDAAAMMRMFMVHTPVAACLVEVTGDVRATLDAIRRRSPATRRIAVTDACDLKMVRELIESGAVHELIYQPLDALTLARAIGIPSRTVTTTTATHAARRPAVSHE